MVQGESPKEQKELLIQARRVVLKGKDQRMDIRFGKSCMGRRLITGELRRGNLGRRGERTIYALRRIQFEGFM